MHTSEVKYLGNLRTEATHMASKSKIITDAPVDNNGKGEAFSPTDLVATALAQCMITIMGIEANKLNIDMNNTQATIIKRMGIGPRRIVEIEIEITLPLSVMEYKEHLEQAAYNCPVAKSLHTDIRQKISFRYA